MSIFGDKVEKYNSQAEERTAQVERKAKVTRLVASLRTLGIDSLDEVDGGKLYSPRSIKEGRSSSEGEYRYPLGPIELKGFDSKANTNLTLYMHASRALFIPEGDPAHDFGKEHQYRKTELESDTGGFTMGVEVRPVFKLPKEVAREFGRSHTDLPTAIRHELGTLYGVDQEGNPLIAIDIKELTDEEKIKLGVGDKTYGNVNLSPDMDRYQEAITALYGAADSIEAEEKK